MDADSPDGDGDDADAPRETLTIAASTRLVTPGQEVTLEVLGSVGDVTWTATAGEVLSTGPLRATYSFAGSGDVEVAATGGNGSGTITLRVHRQFVIFKMDDFRVLGDDLSLDERTSDPDAAGWSRFFRCGTTATSKGASSRAPSTTK
jgi:hypothetical protein